MSALPDTRKLAAVMFADIEGYTSLFQRNETMAIQQVGDHRRDLEEITLRHQGNIIQFYGDGSATVFDSVINAIECAIDLQARSQQHRIPIRIGIHMGDLIIKGGDIYGDVVNIASRIQNLGVSGSVLVSGKVVEELKNHPEIKTTSLGSHSLKNVRTRMEVFAINGNDLVVPHIEQVSTAGKRTWMPIWLLAIVLLGSAGYYWFKTKPKPNTAEFEQGCLIIPAFKDLTGDSLNNISVLAASYVSKMMGGMSDINVLSFESLSQYANADLASFTANPILIRRTGADYSLEGSFSYKGDTKDSLRFFVSILDLKKDQVLPFVIPDVVCATSDPTVGLRKIVDILKGYYTSKKFNLVHHPTYEALVAYNKAVHLWADPKTLGQQKGYLLEAIKADPLFLDAYFLLLDYFYNESKYQNEADTLALVKSLDVELNDRVKNNLLYFEADLDGKTKEAFNYRMKEHRANPKDLLAFTDCMVMAVEYLNDPATAIQLSKDFNIDTFDLYACYYCRTSVNMAMTAYMNNGDLASAGKLAERLKPHAEKAGQFGKLIRYYMMKHDSSSIDFLIQQGVKAYTPAWGKDEAEFLFNLLATRIAFTQGDERMKQRFLSKAISFASDQDPVSQARVYMLTEEWSKAEKLFVEKIKKDPDPWYYQMLGVVYAKMGNQKAADQIVTQLDKLKQPYDFGEIYYSQALVKANLGDTTAALQYLQKAFDEGIKFKSGYFQEDPYMILLNSNSDYQKMIIQYRQTQ